MRRFFSIQMAAACLSAMGSVEEVKLVMVDELTPKTREVKPPTGKREKARRLRQQQIAAKRKAVTTS